jgi:hypothetical protein
MFNSDNKLSTTSYRIPEDELKHNGLRSDFDSKFSGYRVLI